MSGKRYQNLNKVEFQDTWRNQRSADVASNYLGMGPPEIDGTPIKPKIDLEPEKTTVVKDKNETYPPIVTIDGRVDTDIDHLIEDLADDYTGPVDEIPSKFPKPHVFSVIEGSLDDDVDSYANDDGTMEHTLVDAPKILTPSDLKDVASNDVSRKTPNHSNVGQITSSHTDRSHNKMTENETNCDLHGVEKEDGSFLPKDQSLAQLKRNFSDTDRSTREDLKKQRTNEGEDMRRRNTDEAVGAAQKKQSASGRFMTNTSKSDSSGRDVDFYKCYIGDGHAEYPLNSRAIVALNCDSSAHASDVKDCCSSVKDYRSKDTESAMFMQTCTESLTCTFTDESLRESHVSVDVSGLKTDQNPSQSVSESDTETEGHSGQDPERSREVYSSPGDKLEGDISPGGKLEGDISPGDKLEGDISPGDKLEGEFNQKISRCPSYSEDSGTRSSDLCRRGKQPNSQVSSSLAQQSRRQTRHSNHQTSTVYSTKTSQTKPFSNSVVFSDARHNMSEPAKNGEGLEAARKSRHVSVDFCNQQKRKSQHDFPAPSQRASLSSASQVSYQGSGRSTTSESVRKGRLGNLQPYEERSNQSPPADDKLNQKTLLQLPAGATETRTERKYKVEHEHEQTSRNLAQKDQGLSNKIHEARAVNGSSPEIEAGGTNRNKEVSPSCEHGVQVDIQTLDVPVETRGENTEQKQLPIRERRYRPARDHNSVQCKRMQELSSQAGCLTGRGSDTESLDSESQHLLHQLQMAQLTKRRTNALLKHVQDILRQPDQSRDNISESASRKSDKSAEHDSSKQSYREDQAQTRGDKSPKDNSSCTPVRSEGRSLNTDRDVVMATGRERKIPELDYAEAGDKGLVQTLVSTWDKHHRAFTVDKKVTGSQLNKGYTNKWSNRPANENKGRSEASQTTGVHKSKTSIVHESHHSSRTQGTRYVDNPQGCISERDQVNYGSLTDKRPHRNSYEKRQHSQKNMAAYGPMSGLRKSHKTYASTSSDSDTSDTLCDFTDFSLAKSQTAAKSLRKELDNRAASLPRKVRNYSQLNRRTSPNTSSHRDVQKCKRRCESEARRNKVSSSSIKDSLRAVVKVAEESMTAAARVAEALNVVIKATQISPLSCSSMEEKRLRWDTKEYSRSPVLRSKHVDSKAATTFRSQSTSPEQSPKYRYTEQENATRSQAGQSISQRTDKKRRSSHAHSSSRELTYGHSTSLSSPSRKDTFSRNPKNVRAGHGRRDTKLTAADSEWSPSQSPATMSQFNAHARGDTSKVSKDDHVPGVVTDQQVIVQVAYSSSPEGFPLQFQKQAMEDVSENKNMSTSGIFDVEGHDSIQQDTKSVDSKQPRNLSKVRLSEAQLHTENSKHNSRSQPMEMAAFEQTSKLTVSTEEWSIPGSRCSSARKMDSYFTHVPPVIDQNLQSISLSAKQIIRRQVIGSCVDPGLIDSPGSDSIEYNSNFNRAIAGKQLHLSVSHRTEQHTESRLDSIIMNKCSEELDMSQSSDHLLLWQQSASLQYEAGSYPYQAPVFPPADGGKHYENPDTGYCCLSRSHTNRRGTVQCAERCRASYQLHEEEIVEFGDSMESSCLKQGMPEYEASLCYTDDLSSPSSSYIDIQDLYKMFPCRREDDVQKMFPCRRCEDDVQDLYKIFPYHPEDGVQKVFPYHPEDGVQKVFPYHPEDGVQKVFPYHPEDGVQKVFPYHPEDGVQKVFPYHPEEGARVFPCCSEEEYKWIQISEPHKKTNQSSEVKCKHREHLAEVRTVGEQSASDTCCSQVSQSAECPAREQAAPIPKPRNRKLQVSEGEGFVAPGRSTKVQKFSPIYEELWSEEESCTSFASFHVSPHCVQNTNNSNTSPADGDGVAEDDNVCTTTNGLKPTRNDVVAAVAHNGRKSSDPGKHAGLSLDLGQGQLMLPSPSLTWSSLWWHGRVPARDCYHITDSRTVVLERTYSRATSAPRRTPLMAVFFHTEYTDGEKKKLCASISNRLSRGFQKHRGNSISKAHSVEIVILHP